MMFFPEHTSLDCTVLERLGMDDNTQRMYLSDYIGTMFRHVRPELSDAYSTFIVCVQKRLDELESCRTVVDDLQEKVNLLKNDASIFAQRFEELNSRVEMIGKQASDLSVVNGQLNEAISAYKAKRVKAKQDLAERDATIAALRENMADYDRRLANCLADACISDTSSRTRLSELKASNSRLRQRINLRDEVSKRMVSSLKRQVESLKNKWGDWSARSRFVSKRCGCKASVQYYQRTGVDLEWFAAQATSASVAFREELNSTADSMRLEIQVVRMERDDALADGQKFIDWMLRSNEELQALGIRYAGALNELAATKMLLSRRSVAERSAMRSQIFVDQDGIDMVCPVPSIDGYLLPLARVYRAWMESSCGVVRGMGMEFICPISGELDFAACCRGGVP